jgi:hypothetical protein
MHQDDNDDGDAASLELREGMDATIHSIRSTCTRNSATSRESIHLMQAEEANQFSLGDFPAYMAAQEGLHSSDESASGIR